MARTIARTRGALLAAAALALGGCGGGSTPAPNPLAGTWDLVQISTNDGPRWFAASLTVAADGEK